MCGAAAIWLELYCKAWPLTRQPPACSPAKAWWWRWQTPPCPTHLTLPRPASCQTMSSRQSLLSLNFQTSKTAPLSARIGEDLTKTPPPHSCSCWKKCSFSQSKLEINNLCTRYRFLNDENNDVWRMHCIRKLAEEALKSELLSSTPTYQVHPLIFTPLDNAQLHSSFYCQIRFQAKLRAFYHAWNPADCSRNIYVKPNGFTLHR